MNSRISMRISALPLIGAAAFLGAAPAFALSTEDVYGTWRHPDNGSLIEIYPCGGGICAKVAGVTDPKRTDINNPDPALRDRPIVGIEIWRRAKETAPLQWSGSAYNPLDGATLYGTVHLTGDSTLVVASCNLNVMPCYERTWTKVPPETTISTLVMQPEAPQPQPTAIAETPPAEIPPADAKPVEQPKPASPAKPKKTKAQKETKPTRPNARNDYNELPHIHVGR
jgi:uncharacterized protein (DUF2147 family)